MNFRHVSIRQIWFRRRHVRADSGSQQWRQRTETISPRDLPISLSPRPFTSAGSQRGAKSVFAPTVASRFAETISISRIVANQHFPSDIVVGQAIGFLTGTYVLNHRARYRPGHSSVTAMLLSTAIPSPDGRRRCGRPVVGVPFPRSGWRHGRSVPQSGIPRTILQIFSYRSKRSRQI